MPSHLCYPRPEYPRPDRQRSFIEGHDWLNLNGPWQFRFDGERIGIDEKWFGLDQPEWREQIIIPFCWESLAAWGEADAAGNDNYYSTRVFRNRLEVTRENHRSAARYEVGWYRRWVEVPSNAAWRDKRVILTVGAADFFCDCWCNGKHLGHHEGGYTPFEFDLTERLGAATDRKVLLVLRVEDPMENSEQPVGKQWRWYTTTSGIWQTVFIEPRHATHIRSFRVTPDIDAGTARFEIDCVQAQAGSQARIEIDSPDGRKQTRILEVKGDQADVTIALDPMCLWDPNTPELYRLIVTLAHNDRQRDRVHSYFGMRKIDFELSDESGVPTALRLNGVPRYLRGALYQSYHPDGVYTATSEEVLKNDILCAKKFGFNFLRVHIKVDDPILLFWADKLGILLMADFPNFGEGGDTALGRKRFEVMMRETIERDFNHPSIFAWCLFNETWGFGGQNTFLDKLLPRAPAADLSPPAGPTPAQRRTASPSPHEMGRGAAYRSCPPSWTPEQPTESGGITTIVAEAEPRPPPATPAQLSAPKVWVQKMWELAKHLDPTRLIEDMSVCHWEHLEYYQHCDTDINSWHFYINDYVKAKAHIDKVVKSTFVGSSFNYVPGFLHRGQPLINSEYGGIGALDGDKDVSWSFKFLTNELRRHQQIAAYIYTELHDVEWEYNGFLNYDRTPKQFGYDPKVINESNTLPLDAPPVQRAAPGSTVKLEVTSAHFSGHKREGVSLHWLLCGMDSRGRVHRDLARGSVPIRFPHRQVAHAHLLELRLPEFPALCTLMLDARTMDGQIVAQNFMHYFVWSGYPPEREEFERGIVLRGPPANWASAEWSGGFGDRERERGEDRCYGFGHGFFEWLLPLDGIDLDRIIRMKLLCEASSRRVGSPQTDQDALPTTLEMNLNDIPVYKGILQNQPHDSRGVLSYLRGGVGAYGYLIHAVAEKELLDEILEATHNNTLRLCCCVPSEAGAQAGLTIYGAECGRFPVCPTLILDY
jgi:hypothetical protein